MLELARRNDEVAREFAKLTTAAAKQPAEVIASALRSQTPARSSRRSSCRSSRYQYPAHSYMTADKEEEPQNIAAELDRQLQRMEPETESQSQLVCPSSSPDPSLAEDRRNSAEDRCGPVSNVLPPTPRNPLL